MGASKTSAVLLFGAPGVGKGTQGKILDRIPGFRHISSGDVFRGLAPDSPEAQEVARYANRGMLVPDDVTIRVFRSVLQRRMDAGEIDPQREILVLDGIPRTVRQAEFLAEGIEVLAVVQLAFSEADESVMVERLKRRAVVENRPDDADEAVIRRRFEVYRQETARVLAFYPAGRVHRINAVATPIEVLRDVAAALVPVYREKAGEW